MTPSNASRRTGGTAAPRHLRERVSGPRLQPFGPSAEAEVGTSRKLVKQGRRARTKKQSKRENEGANNNPLRDRSRGQPRRSKWRRHYRPGICQPIIVPHKD